MPKPLPPEDEHRQNVDLQSRAIREREGLSLCTVDYKKLGVVIQLLDKPVEVSRTLPDLKYVPPLKKADINHFTDEQSNKLKKHAADIEKIGRFVQVLEQTNRDLSDRLVNAFQVEYVGLLKDETIVGGAFYGRLLDRLRDKVNDSKYDREIELLMLYFFFMCDIFKKEPDETGAL